MNVIEEVELFDESDDDYEIDVDKLIESENIMNERFRKRGASDNWSVSHDSDIEHSEVSTQVVRSRPDAPIPLHQSSKIFGTHKKIEDVTFRNYVNASKPNTLVVSKVERLQPRIDTVGLPLREKGHAKFDDFVVDKKKKAEEDHKLKDFRKSPFSVVNMVKNHQSKEQTTKHQPSESQKQPKKSQKKSPQSASTTSSSGKKVVKVVHHHHYYQTDAYGNTVEINGPLPSFSQSKQEAQQIRNETSPPVPTSNDHISDPKRLERPSSTDSKQSQRTGSSKTNSLSLNQRPTSPTFSDQTNTSERSSSSIQNKVQPQKIPEKKTHSPEPVEIVENIANNQNCQSAKIAFTGSPEQFSSSDEDKGEVLTAKGILKKKEHESAQEMKHKSLLENVEAILTKRDNSEKVERKFQKMLISKERRRVKSTRTNVCQRTSVNSSVASKRFGTAISDNLKYFDFFKMKSLPLEKKLSLEDVQPYKWYSLSNPKELSDLIKQAEMSEHKLLKQAEKLPVVDDTTSEKKDHIVKLIQHQLDVIYRLAERTKHIYKMATSQIDNPEYYNGELDGLAVETQTKPTLRPEKKNNVYPHSIDVYNKKKAAGIKGNYKTVIESKKHAAENVAENSIQKEIKRPASAPKSRTKLSALEKEPSPNIIPEKSVTPNLPKSGSQETKNENPKPLPVRKIRSLRIDVGKDSDHHTVVSESTSDMTSCITEEVMNSTQSSDGIHDHLSEDKEDPVQNIYFNLRVSHEENNIHRHPMY